MTPCVIPHFPRGATSNAGLDFSVNVYPCLRMAFYSMSITHAPEIPVHSLQVYGQNAIYGRQVDRSWHAPNAKWLDE